jgi:hypothetical protein
MTALSGQVRPLGELSEEERHAMPLVAVDELWELDHTGPAELETLALLLQSTGADGIVLLVDGEPAGVLPWQALAAEIEPLAGGRRDQLSGQPASEVRSYRCHHCIPPVRRLPRAGPPPICPRVEGHGPMEAEDL